MRFLTAGESHGPKLLGIIEGLPSGLTINKELINRALAHRQQGPGRGGRMKIEQDRVNLVSGVRGGLTTGAPLALEIENRDWANWEQVMTWRPEADLASRKVTAPRPGHADLAGAQKYHTEVRNILERASARETAMRVAVGSVARQLLESLGVSVRGRVNSVGGVGATVEDTAEYWERVAGSPWAVGDPAAEVRMHERLEQARDQGESLGGTIEIQVCGVPAGLGSHVQWDRKLDGKLAQAVLSVQAIKGVSFGMGFAAADYPGSQVHDPIVYTKGLGFERLSNHAGGIEGGMSNGQPIVIHAVMKPIPTLYKPLRTVDLETKETVEASVERSDICAVPAACVVLQHVAAWVMAEAVTDKFPHDSFAELRQAWEEYREYLRNL